MKKAFDFIDSLTPLFFEVCGYPIVKFHKDYIEVYFDVFSTIRDLELFVNVPCDEFRMFAGDGCITIVFTFYSISND